MLKRLLLVFLFGLALLLAYRGYRHYQLRNSLDTRLSSIVAARPEQVVECAALAQQRPLVVLALGQSNAANHGTLFKSADAPVAMLVGSDCVLTNDPLPGGTGTGSSIWRHVPALLSKELAGRKVLLSVLAVDATTIDDWTRPGSKLAIRLIDQIHGLQQRGLKPDVVLWQQGEADARINTSSTKYQQGLIKLAALLGEAGTQAPVMLARSTVCRTPPHAAIRFAIEHTVAGKPRFVLGPDTDLLLDEAYRSDGCHLNELGLKLAAEAWAAAIKNTVAPDLRNDTKTTGGTTHNSGALQRVTPPYTN